MVYFKLFQSKTTSDGEDRYNFKDSTERNTIYPLTYLNNISGMSDEEKAMRSLPNIHLGDGVKFSIEINKKKLVYFDGTLANDYNILNKYNYIVLNADGKFIYCFINDIQINGSVVVFDVETDILTTELPKNVLNGLKNAKIERRHQNRFYEYETGKLSYDVRVGSKLNKPEDFLKGNESMYCRRVFKADEYTGEDKYFKGWKVYIVQYGKTFNYYVYPYPATTLEVNNEEIDDPELIFADGGTQDYKATSIQVVKTLPVNGYTITKSGSTYIMDITLADIQVETVEGSKLLNLTNYEIENGDEKVLNIDLFDVLSTETIRTLPENVNDNMEPKLYLKDARKFNYIAGSQNLEFSIFDTSSNEINIKSFISLVPFKQKERLRINGAINGVDVDCLLSHSNFSGNILKTEVLDLPQTTDAYKEYMRNNANAYLTGLAIPAISAGAGLALGAMTGGVGAAMIGGTVISQATNAANFAANMSNLKRQPDQLKNAGNDGIFALRTDTVKDYIEDWIIDDNLKNSFKEHLKLYGYADGERYTITNLNDFLIRSRYNYLKFDDDNLVDKLNMVRNKAYKQAIADLLNKGIRLWEITNDIATTFKNEDAVNNKEKYL